MNTVKIVRMFDDVILPKYRTSGAVGMDVCAYEEFEDDLLQEDLSSGETIKNLEGNIAFQNVSFGYSEKSNILKNINLDIKA